MTTIIGVAKGDEIVIAGDGQVSLGQTVIKGSARKVRRLIPGGRDIVAGFAGSPAPLLSSPKTGGRTSTSAILRRCWL